MDIFNNLSFANQIKDFISSPLLAGPIMRYIFAAVIILITLTMKNFVFKRFINLVRKFTASTKTELDDKIIDALSSPSKFIIAFLGFTYAVFIVDPRIMAYNFSINLFRTIIAMVIFWAIFRLSDAIIHFVKGIAKRSDIILDDIVLQVFRNALKVLILLIGLIIIIQEWDYDVGGLIAGLGLGGLAFALAAKDTVANLFGSITIMIERPFSIGDWIYTPHVEGTVEEIGFRSTKIRTFAQALVSIPNSTLSGDPITNWSRMGKRRISFHLGVTYSTTPDKMELCLHRLREMLKNHPDIHPETIMVYFNNFGDSALEIFMYFFSNTTNWQEFLQVKEDVNIKIMKILEELQISVAFPSTSLYIEKNC